MYNLRSRKAPSSSTKVSSLPPGYYGRTLDDKLVKNPHPLYVPPRVTAVPFHHQEVQPNSDEEEFGDYFSPDVKIGAEAIAEAIAEVRIDRLTQELNRLSLGRDRDSAEDDDEKDKVEDQNLDIEHRAGEDGYTMNIKTHKLAYDLSQNESFLDCKNIIELVNIKVPENCSALVASYLSSYAGPPFEPFCGSPVFTIAKHMGIDNDDDIILLHEDLQNIIAPTNDIMQKQAILSHFVTNYENNRGRMNALNKMKVGRNFLFGHNKNNCCLNSRIMKLEDFTSCPDVPAPSQLQKMKVSLDDMIDTDIVKERWLSNPNVFGRQQREQFCLCYNFLLLQIVRFEYDDDLGKFSLLFIFL